MSGQVIRNGQCDMRLWTRFEKPAEKMLAEHRTATDGHWGDR